MKNNYYDDFIVSDEGFVDISGGNSAPQNSQNGGNKNRRKKNILISATAAVVVAALGIMGFSLFQSGLFSSDGSKEFVFKNGAYVSGISLADKTMEEAKILLEEHKESFIKPFSVSIDADGEITKLTQSDFKYAFNIDEVLGSIKNEQLGTASGKSETKTYEITASVTPDSIQENSKKIEEATNRKATNARVSKFIPYSENRFEYEEAKNGRMINTDDLDTKLFKAVDSGAPESRIIVEVEKVEADIKVDDIKKNVVKLASYETVSYNSANGTHNMKTALAACNGSVIEPDAVWSFNSCTGDSNLKSNGYKPAGVISNGELTDGIGGGICQASSTIYNAAVRANMEVEERYCHKWASSYVPTGLDATIDYPRLDLKLSNPTKYQMFIECKLVDSTLYVSIWGVKDASYDEIKLHNETTKKEKSSYTVKAWRVYYKDGKEVDRESLGSSSYDMDKSHGYVFIAADVDENAKNTNVDNIEDTTNPESSRHESSSSSSSSKPQSSTAPQKPTQPPTHAPTNPPTQPVTVPETTASTQPSAGETQ